jgi:hypothetical protein
MTFDPHDLPEEDRQEVIAQAAVVSEAWTFLQRFYAGDLPAAWGVIHPTYRLCLAQWWVGANQESLTSNGYDLEEAADELAATPGGEHDLWNDFSRVVLRDFPQGVPSQPRNCGHRFHREDDRPRYRATVRTSGQPQRRSLGARRESCGLPDCDEAFGR